MTSIRIPWFSVPIGLVALIHPRTQAVGRSDLALLRGGGWTAVAWAIGLGIPLGVVLSPGVDDVYTESIVFLLLAVGVGAAAPTLGALLIAAFVPVDLVVYLTQARGVTLLSVGGRALTWWMLWLVAVEVPILARHTTWALARRTSGWVGLGAGAIGAGIAVFAWAQAMPYLLRPMYVAQRYASSPTVDAVAPLQRWAWLLALVALVATVAARPDRRPEQVSARRVATAFSLRGPIAYLPGILLVGLVMLGVAESLLQYLILPAAFVASVAIARRAGSSPRLQRWLGRVPVLLRLLVGLTLVTLVGVVLTGGGSIGSDFRIYIHTAAIGMLIFSVLLAPYELRSEVGSMVAIVGLGAWLMLGVGLPALADNCSGGSDCNNSAWATGAAAGGAGGLLALESVRAAKQGKAKLKEFAVDKAKGDLGDPGKEYKQMVDEADKTGKEAWNFSKMLERAARKINEALGGDSGDSGGDSGKEQPDPPSDWPGDDPSPPVREWED